MDKKIDLSIVILNYNTKKLLGECLSSLEKYKGDVKFETIVVDNGSTDGSLEYITHKFPSVTLVSNNSNLGFARGNNSARKYCHGKFVLFLNSDTQVYEGTLKKTVTYLEEHTKVGAVTCRTILLDGRDDRDAKRSFPTPWVAFTHFSGLDKLFPHSITFAKYWYGYRSNDETMEIEVLQGAYALVRKNLLDEIGWFDEAYFLDGEDIDLCWKIKKKGFKIIYLPEVSILHVKGASKGKIVGHNKVLTKEERKRIVNSGVDSMLIFYKKHLQENYSIFITLLVVIGINIIKLIRNLRA